MKKLLFFLCFLVSPVFSAGVIQYDTKTDYCLRYLGLIDENKYMGVPGYLILTEKTEMTIEQFIILNDFVPIKYLKKTGESGIVEMDQMEKDAIDAVAKTDSDIAQGKQYKNIIENDLVIQTIIEEVALAQGVLPDDLKIKIEQSIADDLGLQKL